MKVRTEDGTLIDTAKALAIYVEATDWNGSNHVSRNTGCQWQHETLYRSARGRWYVVYSSDWQGTRDSVEFLDPEDAGIWLELNGHALPAGLASVAE